MGAVLSSLARALNQLTDPAIWRVIVKSVLITLLIFAGIGVGLYFAMVWLFAASGWSDAAQSGGGFTEAVLAGLIAVIAFWFLFRVVALAVLQFFADEVVLAVEQRHYPRAAANARPLPFRHDLANSIRGLVRAIGFNVLALPFALALLFTGFGPALVFLAVNAWLLGRELTDLAWLRHCGGAERDNPVPGGQRLLLGGVIAAAMLVPGVNLLMPVIGAAAGTHLAQRAMSAPAGTEQAHA